MDEITDSKKNSIEFTAQIKEIVVLDMKAIAVIGKRSKTQDEGVNVINDDDIAAANVINVLVSYTPRDNCQILKGGRCYKRNEHRNQLRNHMSRDMTKPTKWLCVQRRLRSAWASTQSDQSSLSAWTKLGSLATHWAHSEVTDQTGRMPRLIWVFAGRTLILLVLSCRGSHAFRLCVEEQW